MTFREVYSRLVEESRRAMCPAHWFPSLGTRQEGQRAALDAAVAARRLTRDFADQLLPAPAPPVSATALLEAAASSTTDPVVARERIDTVRKLLAMRKQPGEVDE